MKNLLLILSIGLMSISCSKEPGVGGKATVSGKVEAYYVNEDSFDTVEIAAVVDARVYIVYGTGTTQDDDTRTSPDGSFKFDDLNEGDYRLYTYSESLVNSSGLEEVYETITVSKNDESVTVPTFMVVQYVK